MNTTHSTIDHGWRGMFVHETLLDEIESKFGFRPTQAHIEHPTFIVWDVIGEDIMDFEFMTEERFNETYKFHEPCERANCAILDYV